MGEQEKNITTVSGEGVNEPWSEVSFTKTRASMS